MLLQLVWVRSFGRRGFSVAGDRHSEQVILNGLGRLVRYRQKSLDRLARTLSEKADPMSKGVLPDVPSMRFSRRGVLLGDKRRMIANDLPAASAPSPGGGVAAGFVEGFAFVRTLCFPGPGFNSGAVADHADLSVGGSDQFEGRFAGRHMRDVFRPVSRLALFGGEHVIVRE